MTLIEFYPEVIPTRAVWQVLWGALLSARTMWACTRTCSGDGGDDAGELGRLPPPRQRIITKNGMVCHVRNTEEGTVLSMVFMALSTGRT